MTGTNAHNFNALFYIVLGKGSDPVTRFQEKIQLLCQRNWCWTRITQSWFFIVFFLWTSEAWDRKCFLLPAWQTSFILHFLVVSTFIWWASFSCSSPDLHLTVCYLTRTAPVHLTGWWRVAFWKLSWHKTVQQCYHREWLLGKRCSVWRDECQGKGEQWLFMHTYALFPTSYTALFSALPCAQPSLRAKSTPCHPQNLWKPTWPEISSSARRDPPPSHMAHSRGL